MDIVFHAVSAGVLAGRLGERRRRQLLLGAFIGVSPDLLWLVPFFVPELKQLYSWQHSLLVNAPLCLLLCLLNWRIAYGSLLHLAVDVFTHSSSTMHLLYPFARPRLPVGTAWWSWPGLVLWAGLWLGLLWLLWFELKNRMACRAKEGNHDEAK